MRRIINFIKKVVRRRFESDSTEWFIITGITSTMDGYLISGFASEQEAQAYIDQYEQQFGIVGPQGEDGFWCVETKKGYQGLILDLWEDGSHWNPICVSKERFPEAVTEYPIQGV